MNDETKKARKPAAPKGLDIAGLRLWKAVVGQYKLRVDDLFVLESACRVLDTVTALDTAMVGQPLTVTGSMGQQREHPLLSEVRQQRNLLARCLAQLKLPEVDQIRAAVYGGQRSSQMRDVANARWGGNAPWASHNG